MNVVVARADLVVVDLDNTLYDWVGAFVPAFRELVAAAAQILALEPDQLLHEMRAVHRRHGDSEHPFALLETASVQSRFDDVRTAKAALDPAFHAFNRSRKLNLRLYDTVETTLETIKACGVPIVAYTDARAASALFRTEKLGLKRYLDRLYTPAGPLSADPVVATADFVKLLDPNDRKPNPQILKRIHEAYGIAAGRTLYVGDSPGRDVAMAQAAGCRSAWARYGTTYDAAHVPLLVKVSHWSDEDIARDRHMRSEAAGVRADCTLDTFGELLDHFQIGASATDRQRRRPPD